MSRTSNPPPTPAVEHLPTVFRRIRSGEYRVPPFQREFVWDEKQVLELLESVYRGYPIGSALLWKVDRKVFKSIKDPSVGFPLTKEEYPASFVLDGVQRLSSLNGVFNRGEVVDDRRLDVHFDLEKELFVNSRDLDSSAISIPLQTTFRPRAFLEEQKRLAALPNSDLLLERAINLLTVFQEYLFPIVTIFNKDSQDVVSIFQRINSTGIKLGVVDFMRALTWSDDFDLSRTLLDLQSHFDKAGFIFDDELLLKALGIVMGLQPLPDVLLALRGRSAQDLTLAAQELESDLDEVIQFVTHAIGVSNSDALPYEAQWLLLFRLRHEGIDLSLKRKEVLTWIRTTSFTESLQGRPDHALTRMIDDLAKDVKSGRPLRAAPVHLAVDDILFKRFTRGKAMTVAYVQGLIDKGIFDEKPLAEIPYGSFFAVFNSEQLRKYLGREVTSARTIGNVVYLPKLAGYKSKSSFEIILSMRSDKTQKELLEKQHIDKRFFSLATSGDIDQALIYRAEQIIASTRIVF